MDSYSFVLADVFTDQPLTGNQLVVLLDAQGLSDGQMLSIAREFNHSETTFVLPARQAKAAWRLRTFSPQEEVFGAGHQSLGAWWVLAERGLVSLTDPATTVWQELGGKVLPVVIYSEAGKPLRVAMRQDEPRFGDKLIERAALARALSLDPVDLEAEGVAAQAVSTGAWHLLVPAQSLSVLERVRVDAQALIAVARPLGCEGCYLYCLETQKTGVVARARAFAPGIGIPEDPATGTAAGPLGAYLASQNLITQGDWVVIEQGIEMGRPSQIEVRVQGQQIEVAGRSVIVAEGAVSL